MGFFVCSLHIYKPLHHFVRQKPYSDGPQGAHAGRRVGRQAGSRETTGRSHAKEIPREGRFRVRGNPLYRGVPYTGKFLKRRITDDVVLHTCKQSAERHT